MHIEGVGTVRPVPHNMDAIPLLGGFGNTVYIIKFEARGGPPVLHSSFRGGPIAPQTMRLVITANTGGEERGDKQRGDRGDRGSSWGESDLEPAPFPEIGGKAKLGPLRPGHLQGWTGNLTMHTLLRTSCSCSPHRCRWGGNRTCERSRRRVCQLLASSSATAYSGGMEECIGMLASSRVSANQTINTSPVWGAALNSNLYETPVLNRI